MGGDQCRRLARVCQVHDLPFVTFSTDLVFNGRRGRPYIENDLTAPLNVYGASKAAAERTILHLGSRALIVRTAAFFSAYDPHNFAAQVLRTLAAAGEFNAADDLLLSPTHVADLVNATLDLRIDGEVGVRHLANDGAVSWAGFARQLAVALDLDPGRIRGAPSASFGWAAPRPASAVLGTAQGLVMPSLDDAIGRFAQDVRASEFDAEGAPQYPAPRTQDASAVG